MGHHEEATALLGCVSARGADQLHEGVGAMLVQGCVSLRCDLLEQSMESGLGLDVGLLRKLGRDGAVLVVETHVAPLVL